jgi:hypothetical protein
LEASCYLVIVLLFGSGHNFGPTAPLAQSAEQLTLNQWVPGSSPGGCTNKWTASRQVVLLFVTRVFSEPAATQILGRIEFEFDCDYDLF